MVASVTGLGAKAMAPSRTPLSRGASQDSVGERDGRGQLEAGKWGEGAARALRNKRVERYQVWCGGTGDARTVSLKVGSAPMGARIYAGGVEPKRPAVNGGREDGSTG